MDILNGYFSDTITLYPAVIFKSLIYLEDVLHLVYVGGWPIRTRRGLNISTRCGKILGFIWGYQNKSFSCIRKQDVTDGQ